MTCHCEPGYICPHHPAATPRIRTKDRVQIDGGSRVYTVQAVSRAGQDVYLTDGADTSIGTWVDLRSVTQVDGEAVA